MQQNRSCNLWTY